jgi:hypothetical protein
LVPPEGEDEDPLGPTYQAALAEDVVGMGYNFDQFLSVAVSQGWIPESASFGSFAELPETLCKDLHESYKVLATLLRDAFPKPEHHSDASV